MSDFFQALFGSAAYSVFGFLCGWLLGQEAKILREIREHVVETGSTEGRESVTSSPSHRSPWYTRLGTFLLLLAAFTVLQSAYFTYQQREATECLSDYNETIASVQQLRADWVDQDRQALLVFFKNYADDEDADAHRAALINLMNTYERNSINRAETPLPELKTCY